MKSTPPLVSVVIPTYNRSGPVLEAAKSVLAQTFRDFELIVADDGSEDDTLEALKTLGFREIRDGAAGRLGLLRLRHLGMPGAVRNRGAALARGRYLAFLDSDDLWEPAKLERQLRLFADGKSGLAHTRELWLRNGRVVSQAGQKHRREGDLFSDSLRKCVIGPSTVMLEKKLYDEAGGFREDLEIAEDYELWLRLTARENVAYLDENLTVKKAGGGDQLSEKYGQIEVFRLRALRGLLERGFFAFDPAKQGKAAAEFARKAAIYAAGCRKRGKLEEAEFYEKTAAEN